MLLYILRVFTAFTVRGINTWVSATVTRINFYFAKCETDYTNNNYRVVIKN